MREYCIIFDRTIVQRKHVDIVANSLEEAQERAKKILSSGDLHFIKVISEEIKINSVEEVY